MEQWIVTILDTCNVYEILRHKERKRERERERRGNIDDERIEGSIMFLWSVSLSVGVEAGGHRTDFPFSPPPSLLPFLKATLQRGKLSTFISANDKSMRRLRRQNGSITSNTYRTDLRFDFSFVSTVQRSFFRLLKYMVSFHMVKKNEFIKIA